MHYYCYEFKMGMVKIHSLTKNKNKTWTRIYGEKIKKILCI